MKPLQRNKPLYFVSLFIGLVLWNSCNKDSINLQTIEIQTQTTDDLNSVFFVNDSIGFASGGEKYAKGILFRTTDGGHTWSVSDSVSSKAIYTSYFFSQTEGYLGGFDSHINYTNDSAKTFSDRVFPNYLPIRCISFYDTQNGIFAAGSNYSDGSWGVTHDGGKNWNESAKQIHAFRCAAFADQQTILIGGYGTILRSTDGGANFATVKHDGDFYTGMKFIQSNLGLAVGYQGEIVRSTDKGASWSTAKKGNNPFGQADHFLALDFFDAQNGFAVGESGLMMHTTDGGQNWKTVKSFTDKSLRAIHLFSSTNGVIVGEGGKVFLFKE